MTINPSKMLLAAAIALPLFAAASAAQAAPTISDHDFFPSDVHAQRYAPSVFDARASIDMPVTNTSAAECNYAGGPKLDDAFCN
jgi:hypothetical protein